MPSIVHIENSNGAGHEVVGVAIYVPYYPCQASIWSDLPQQRFCFSWCFKLRLKGPKDMQCLCATHAFTKVTALVSPFSITGQLKPSHVDL
jgi:hypothetical protein